MAQAKILSSELKEEKLSCHMQTQKYTQLLSCVSRKFTPGTAHLIQTTLDSVM